MHDLSPAYNGHPSWPPPNQLDILLRIEGRLSGLERGQQITADLVQRRFDHTDLKLDTLEERTTTLEVLQRHSIQSPMVSPTPVRVPDRWWLSPNMPWREIAYLMLVLIIGLLQIVGGADMAKVLVPPR